MLKLILQIAKMNHFHFLILEFFLKLQHLIVIILHVTTFSAVHPVVANFQTICHFVNIFLLH